MLLQTECRRIDRAQFVVSSLAERARVCVASSIMGLSLLDNEHPHLEDSESLAESGLLFKEGVPIRRFGFANRWFLRRRRSYSRPALRTPSTSPTSRKTQITEKANATKEIQVSLHPNISWNN